MVTFERTSTLQHTWRCRKDRGGLASGLAAGLLLVALATVYVAKRAGRRDYVELVFVDAPRPPAKRRRTAKSPLALLVSLWKQPCSSHA